MLVSLLTLTSLRIIKNTKETEWSSIPFHLVTVEFFIPNKPSELRYRFYPFLTFVYTFLIVCLWDITQIFKIWSQTMTVKV